MEDNKRVYTRKELFDHWKFCGNILNIVKDRNEESTNPVERLSTKFTCECIIEIMDDLASLIDSNKP